MTASKFPTLNRVNTLIDSLGDLSPAEEVRAQNLRTLAERIDNTKDSRTGTTSMALTQLVKQLGSSIDDLLRTKPAKDEFLDWLLAPEETKEAYLDRKSREATAQVLAS
jgi:hypothetical protein